MAPDLPSGDKRVGLQVAFALDHDCGHHPAKQVKLMLLIGDEKHRFRRRKRGQNGLAAIGLLKGDSVTGTAMIVSTTKKD